eukprot:gene25413-biopygen20985
MPRTALWDPVLLHVFLPRDIFGQNDFVAVRKQCAGGMGSAKLPVGETAPPASRPAPAFVPPSALWRAGDRRRPCAPAERPHARAHCTHRARAWWVGAEGVMGVKEVLRIFLISTLCGRMNLEDKHKYISGISENGASTTTIPWLCLPFPRGNYYAATPPQRQMWGGITSTGMWGGGLPAQEFTKKP